MKLSYNFRVYDKAIIGYTYSVKHISGDTFNVSWEARGGAPAGDILVSRRIVEGYIERGDWILIDSDSFENRLAFFQQHIDAVKENLESLQAAFNALKRPV